MNKPLSILPSILAAWIVCWIGPCTAPAQTLSAAQVVAATERLDELAAQTLRKTGVPGIAIAVVHADQLVLLRGYGVCRAGGQHPIDGDTVFPIASVSKPIATTVMAALVGDGTIDWDSRISDLMPQFQLQQPWVTRQLTLRDLLCHRSGLPDHAGDLLEDMGYGREEILHRLRFLDASSNFRSRFAYTNFGFTAAAVAAAKVAGEPWEQLAMSRLYQPLQMNATSSRFEDWQSATNRADLHHFIEGAWVPRYVRDADAQAPAGGVCSTARDLSNWMRMQLDGGRFQGRQVIDAEALKQTHRPQIVSGFNQQTGRPSFYGLGWNVSYDQQGRLRLSHSGAFVLGVRTEVALLPGEDIGIAVLSNAAPTGIPEGLTESFFDLLFQGKVSRDWVSLANEMFRADAESGTGYATDYSQYPSRQTAALPSEAYVGSYDNEYYGRLQVVEQDEGLWLLLGPGPQRYELAHWDRDLFTYQPVGENAGGRSGVQFSIGADQRASRVHVENLAVGGPGTFVRPAENSKH